jgi:hypothetical protein
MIRDFEKYHGAVLTRLVHALPGVTLELYPGLGGNSAYVIDKCVGLYIKYSTKRLTPWTFTFMKDQQDEIHEMASVLDQIFIALVCHDDGIACLSHKELKSILDEVYDPAEWVRVSRRPKEKYAISGSDGKLKGKIGENEFPVKLSEFLVPTS